MKNRTGQCYCGTVKYEIQGDFGFIEPDEDVGVHINLESKAPWQTAGDARPQHESFPPDMQELFQKLMHEKG
jgi:hypothetical protein